MATVEPNNNNHNNSNNNRNDVPLKDQQFEDEEIIKKIETDEFILVDKKYFMGSKAKKKDRSPVW
eukprot:CAMPEP_0201590422 /NCGR_PEP_ID=MMETSP0190_2-20130828/177605_1 /ASSEMBLY_ACC=CAM_ASM_000263 /TAXON_ID=37353 /ORGANISM="Rosalina sp." /LENGTH=64 /DNA_ID=CAMNT_0048046533 /DNA_START=33 /DNA_END=224 /DNA_ORIENTATION=-